MISVVIPLYNKGKSITNTITKVLEQTYHDFEIIVVDDGSTDNGPEEVLKLPDKRIRLIHQENAGVSAARNHGIKEAKYNLIAFLDADDEWMPEYLQTQYMLSLKYPDCSVFACNYQFMDSTGKVTNTRINKVRFSEIDGIMENYFEVASYSHPPLWTSAVVVRKMAIESIGGFPVGVKSGEDLLTWARLASNFQIAYSKRVLAIFHIVGYQYTEKPKRIPAEIDFVGTELKKILKTHPDRIAIRKYISHWHKMRSSIYMRLNMRTRSIKESIIGLKYNIFNYKLYVYIIINLLPKKFFKL